MKIQPLSCAFHYMISCIPIYSRVCDVDAQKSRVLLQTIEKKKLSHDGHSLHNFYSFLLSTYTTLRFMSCYLWDVLLDSCNVINRKFSL